MSSSGEDVGEGVEGRSRGRRESREEVEVIEGRGGEVKGGKGK